MFIWWVPPSYIAKIGLLGALLWVITTQPQGERIAIYAILMILAFCCMLLMRALLESQLGCLPKEYFRNDRSLACTLRGRYSKFEPRSLPIKGLAFAVVISPMVVLVREPARYQPAARLVAMTVLSTLLFLMLIRGTGMCMMSSMTKRMRKGGSPTYSAGCIEKGGQRYGTDGHVYEVRHGRWMKVRP